MIKDLRHIPALACCALLSMTMLYFAPSVNAQSRVGTTAGTFLTVGAGARGSALGNAYTAEATGPDGLFWNPGSAARPGPGGKRGGAMFTNSKWVADIDFNMFGVVFPVAGSAVMGLSVQAVDYGRMDVRTVTQPDGTGETFDAADLSFGVTYSMPLTPSFYFGGTAKYVSQRIRDMSANTFAVDFGFILETDYLNGARVAASIRNFGGKLRMDGINSDILVDVDPTNNGSSESVPARLRMQAWDLPLSFKFGVAVPAVSTENFEVLLLGDINQTNDNKLNSDLGGQFRYRTRNFNLDLRIGYKDAGIENVDSHLTYGAGLNLAVSRVRFAFDFAYVPFDYLDDSRIIDFRVYF